MSSDSALKADKRARRLRRLEKKQVNKTQSEDRSAHRGAPDEGFNEAKGLLLMKQFADLTTASNANTSELRSYQEHGVADKAVEAHYMLQVVLGILVEKGLTTPEEIQARSEKVQAEDLGLSDKPEPADAAMGDLLYINFQVFDADLLVIDETAAPMAYSLGSGALNCDEALVGMVKGETRTCQVVFDNRFAKKDLVGKTLTVVIKCIGIKAPKT